MALSLQFVSLGLVGHRNNKHAAKLVRSHAARVSHGTGHIVNSQGPNKPTGKRRRRRKDEWSFEVHVTEPPSMSSESSGSSKSPKSRPSGNGPLPPISNVMPGPVIPALQTKESPPYLSAILDNCAFRIPLTSGLC